MEEASCGSPSLVYSRSDDGGLLEGNVLDGIIPPIVVIEVPPFFGVNRKTVGFHYVTQPFASGALNGGPAGIIGIAAVAGFVVGSYHLHGLSCKLIANGEIDGAAAVVT